MTELHGPPTVYADYLEEIEREVLTSQQRERRMPDLSLVGVPPEDRRALSPAAAVVAGLAIARPDADDYDEAANDE